MTAAAPARPRSDWTSAPVLCFGEILWDLLPHGAFPGGAPFNVASHLQRLGIPAVPVSAVGRDAWGERILAVMAERGVTDAGVARLADVPTGTVTAELTPRGDARYTIVENVAWDRIPVSEAVAAPAAASRALVYGSLALRSAANRDALGRLLEAVPTYAWRVFDVNLRAPFDDLTLVREYARHANLLKLNAEEAARLAGEPGRDAGAEEEHARRLAAETGVGWVCITSGDRGAGVLRGGRWTWEPGRQVDVVDTVGAGDAFLAQLLAGLLAGGRSEAQLVADACRRGEWVASRAGACPDGPGPEQES